MPRTTQVKLLRVLEQQEFIRVGGSTPVKTDVRLIASTNRDLAEEIRDGTFRQDLYYRLNAVHIHLPALRERREDISRLIHHFLHEARERLGVSPPVFTAEALATLTDFEWPGNIRELRNLVETLVVTAGKSRIDADDLPKTIYTPPMSNRALPVPQNRNPEDMDREMFYKILWQILTAIHDLPSKITTAFGGGNPAQLPERFQLPAPVEEEQDIGPPVMEISDSGDMDRLRTMGDWEREAIRRALERNEGHRGRAARELGISERSIYRKIKDYGLEDHA